MNPTLGYNDLVGLLDAAHAGEPISKATLFTALLYHQPAIDRLLMLHDVAQVLNLSFEAASAQFKEFESEIKAVQRARQFKPLPNPKRPTDLSAKTAELEIPLTTCLAHIQPQSITWLWPNYIPIGCAVMVTGDPGCGKTWFSLDTAARLSRGTRWIDGSEVGDPANSIYLTVEDDIGATIRPHLDGLGGDPEHVFVYDPTQLHLDLSTGDGLDRLEKEIEKIGNVKLVVIDPIIDFSGGINPNKGEEVRALLTPLIGLASRLGFALLLISHLNKAQAMNAIYRAGGSTSGWLGKCRAAFILFRDIYDKQLRHVAPLKTNLAQGDPPQLEFRLNEGQMTAKVSSEEVNIDEHLNPRPHRKPREREDAQDWLENLFTDRNEIPATEIEEKAKSDRISPRTLKRAKAASGYISKRVKNQDGNFQWIWQKISISSVDGERE